MSEQKKYTLEYGILALVLAGAAFLIIQMQVQDVLMCKRLFRGLIEADMQVQKNIDWAHLKAVGKNVGAEYLTMRGSKRKAQYRQLFIQYFGQGFKAQKSKFEDFVNWRIYSKDLTKVVVAADYPAHKKTMLFTFSRVLHTLNDIRWK